jgi:N-acyl-D-amino-acid deacylase
MLRRPLDFDPGQRFAYSNFGYSLLGRVIEAVSGMRYEDYVRQRVLQPIGIESMQIGQTRASERAEGEVRYVASGTGPSVFDPPTSPNDQAQELSRSGSDFNTGDSNIEAKRAETVGEQVPQAYGAWYLEAMDSHGGWLASAVDLARFALALEDSSPSGLLKRETIALMNARPAGLAGFDDAGKPKDIFYSLGWQNRVVGDNQVNRWHTGSLPGTTAILIRRHDGRNLIALLNTRESPASKELGLDLDRLLHKAANKVETWPTQAVIE